MWVYHGPLKSPFGQDTTSGSSVVVCEGVFRIASEVIEATNLYSTRLWLSLWQYDRMSDLALRLLLAACSVGLGCSTR